MECSGIFWRCPTENDVLFFLILEGAHWTLQNLLSPVPHTGCSRAFPERCPEVCSARSVPWLLTHRPTAGGWPAGRFLQSLPPLPSLLSRSSSQSQRRPPRAERLCPPKGSASKPQPQVAGGAQAPVGRGRGGTAAHPARKSQPLDRDPRSGCGSHSSVTSPSPVTPAMTVLSQSCLSCRLLTLLL